MTTTTRDRVRQMLEETHQSYCRYNQTESEYCRSMAASGHPFAEEYRKLRAEFDRLKYCCNSDARRISYRNEGENAEYWAPSLRVDTRWHCEEDELGVPPDVREKFSGLWGCCPADGGKWECFLELAAEIGWPEQLKPKLDSGSFHIRTRNHRMVADLVLATRMPVQPVDYYGNEEGVKPYWHFNLYHLGYERTMKVLEVIRKRHKRWLLPERTPDDNEVDQAPLPLHHKEFMVGHVKEVTVTDHSVLVPMIPLDGTGDMIVRRAIGDLVELCQQGYPWKGAVRDWVFQWLKYKKDKNRYDKMFKDQREP